MSIQNYTQSSPKVFNDYISQQMFERSIIPHFILNRKNHIIKANKAFYELTKYVASKPFSSNPQPLLCFFNMKKENTKKLKALTTQEKTSISLPFTTTLNNNKTIYLKANFTGIYNKIEELEYTYVIAKDITEVMEKEAIINEMVIKLSQNNQALDEYINKNLHLENFAYLASHDLITPVQNIINFIALLKSSCNKKLTATENKYLDYLENSSSELKTIINSLLKYTLINIDENVKYETIELKPLLTQIINANFSFANVEFEFEFEAQCIKANKKLITTLFFNLIQNAVKFSKPNTKNKIKIGNTNEDLFYTFWVKDNGIGIDAQFHQKVFGLFKKLHNKSKYSGNGIGLALCKSIVKQHFGEIWVESTKNIGSEFYFKIGKL